MNWDDARVFLAVEREKTLRGAARALNLDQATVGRRLAALEHAKSFLTDSVLSGITANREAELESIEEDIKRADPFGTTIDTKLRKIAAFERVDWKIYTLRLHVFLIEGFYRILIGGAGPI